MCYKREADAKYGGYDINASMTQQLLAIIVRQQEKFPSVKLPLGTLRENI